MKSNRRISNYDLFASYSWHVPGVNGMFGLLGLLLAGMILGSICLGIMMLALSRDQAMAYGTPVVYVIQFLPVMLYSLSASRRNALFEDGYKLDNNNYAPQGGLCLAIVVSLAIIASAFGLDPLNNILPPISEKWESALKALTDGPLLLTLLSVSVFAPIFEEWLCRGMVLRGLLYYKRTRKDGSVTQGIKPVWAIVISAVFFAAIHGNLWQGFAAFLLGCLFGYVYWKTGSLKLTMLMHCVNNTFSVLITKLFPELSQVDSMKEILSPEAYMVSVVLGLAVLAACIWMISKVKPLTPQGSCELIPADGADAAIGGAVEGVVGSVAEDTAEGVAADTTEDAAEDITGGVAEDITDNVPDGSTDVKADDAADGQA